MQQCILLNYSTKDVFKSKCIIPPSGAITLSWVWYKVFYEIGRWKNKLNTGSNPSRDRPKSLKQRSFKTSYPVWCNKTDLHWFNLEITPTEGDIIDFIYNTRTFKRKFGYICVIHVRPSVCPSEEFLVTWTPSTS